MDSPHSGDSPNMSHASDSRSPHGAARDAGPASADHASVPAVRQQHFLDEIIRRDAVEGTWGLWSESEAAAGPVSVSSPQAGQPRVHTRFPPEPNGYLHIGHCKSILLNFGLARDYRGLFNMRFDDTNPSKEDQEYVDSIIRDVLWLGADFRGPNGGGLHYASDYFEFMYAAAEELIRKGMAYVCTLSADEVSSRRGAPGVPATSPHRDRPPEESVRLFREMRAGVHANGSMTLRAKIDLASPNFNMRDPVLYRIVHAPHHNTGDTWCIYPMYDWAHGLEDSQEGITHSICTLEFEIHRPLYDWLIDAVNAGRAPRPRPLIRPAAPTSDPSALAIHHPRQIEFARLNISYTLMSKRFLLKLVQDRAVSGWDDPRMPTISALRRRGYTPESIAAFIDDVGVTRQNSVIDASRLENALRDHLNRIAPRRMAVLRPLKIVITNWADGGPADRAETMNAVNNPEDASAGSRPVAFTREVFIERDDFMENPPKKFFRLAPGVEVRLRYAYWVRCTGVVKNDAGEVTEVHCTYDPSTRGGNDPPPAPDGSKRKVKATLHWVSADPAQHARAQVRLFDRLFSAEVPGERTGNPGDDLNPNSLEIIQSAVVEASLAGASWRVVESPPPAGMRRSTGAASRHPELVQASWIEPDRFQFERLGYFSTDPDSRPGAVVFNRSVPLKDAWAKEAAKE